MKVNRWVGSIIIFLIIALILGALATWKYLSIQHASAAAATGMEPMESVTVAVAEEREHQRTTTSIGTITALRSITLRNEVPGTVKTVRLHSGQVVETGTVLVTLDVSVEEAELREQEAQVALAESTLKRMESLNQTRALSEIEVDRARAQLAVAGAQVERTKAVIARKIIRAPFRSRVGISNVHEGQYLNEGTELTTLQGVDSAVHVDFAVPQHIAQGLSNGDAVNVLSSKGSQAIPAKITAVDALIDQTTRNATVRARIENASSAPAPGASVRVEVPSGPPGKAIAIPVSALRKGPSGDHVFVITPDKDGKHRAFAKQVQSGAMLGDVVLIHSGLSAGEQVAAMGSFKLRDGILVVINQQTTAAQ